MTEPVSTATYIEFVDGLFNKSGDPSKDFTHALLGLHTELFELFMANDPTNELEELGDLEFYITAMAIEVGRLAGVSAESLLSSQLNSELKKTDPGVLLNELMDTAKRWVGYGKVPNNPLRLYDIAAVFLDGAAESCMTTVGLSRDRRRASNMAKLIKRYPEGKFDQFRALNRDLEAERLVLEAH